MKSLDDILVSEPMLDGYDGDRVLIPLGKLKKRIEWNQYMNSVETHNGTYGWYDKQRKMFLFRDWGFIFHHEYSFPDKKTAEIALKKYLSLAKDNVPQESKYFSGDICVKKFPKNIVRRCVWQKNDCYDYSLDS